MVNTLAGYQAVANAAPVDLSASIQAFNDAREKALKIGDLEAVKLISWAVDTLEDNLRDVWEAELSAEYAAQAARRCVQEFNCYGCGERIQVGDEMGTTKGFRPRPVCISCDGMTEADVRAAYAAWCRANGVRVR